MNRDDLQERLAAEGYGHRVERFGDHLWVRPWMIRSLPDGRFVVCFEERELMPHGAPTDEHSACAELYRLVSGQFWCASTSWDRSKIDAIDAKLAAAGVPTRRNDIDGAQFAGHELYRTWVLGSDLRRAAEIAGPLTSHHDEPRPY